MFLEENGERAEIGSNLVRKGVVRAADFWRFHIPSKMPKADSFPNLDPKETFSDRYDSYEALRLNDGPTGQSGNLNLALLTCWGAST